MDFRHEWKHEISFPDLLILRQRLRVVARTDPHSVNGKYEIRSLYFDNWQDKALREKIDGVNIREKFRIRYYNGDKSFIQLEKKTKINGLGKKQNAALTEKEAQAIVDGDYEWMRGSNEMLITELYSKILSQCLRPKTIVDYTREAFVYAPGNVRITLDYNIRTGLTNTDFLDTDCVTVSAGTPVIILEVKWDSFLPSVIQDAIQLEGRRTTAFSKYAACRIYG
jgi:hypothetical protein